MFTTHLAEIGVRKGHMFSIGSTNAHSAALADFVVRMEILRLMKPFQGWCD